MSRGPLDPARWELASRLFDELADVAGRERGARLRAATDDRDVIATVEAMFVAEASGPARPLDATPGA